MTEHQPDIRAELTEAIETVHRAAKDQGVEVTPAEAARIAGLRIMHERVAKMAGTRRAGPLRLADIDADTPW